jgi:hypothetical protein
VVRINFEDRWRRSSGRISIPYWGKNFFFFTESRPDIGPFPAPLPIGTEGAVSQGVKRLGWESVPATSISAEVKEIYTSTPPYVFTE